MNKALLTKNGKNPLTVCQAEQREWILTYLYREENYQQLLNASKPYYKCKERQEDSASRAILHVHDHDTFELKNKVEDGEIIPFQVCLMSFAKKSIDGRAKNFVKRNRFESYASDFFDWISVSDQPKILNDEIVNEKNITPKTIFSLGFKKMGFSKHEVRDETISRRKRKFKERRNSDSEFSRSFLQDLLQIYPGLFDTFYFDIPFKMT